MLAYIMVAGPHFNSIPSLGLVVGLLKRLS
jgi:hypothetical protein